MVVPVPVFNLRDEVRVRLKFLYSTRPMSTNFLEQNWRNRYLGTVPTYRYRYP